MNRNRYPTFTVSGTGTELPERRLPGTGLPGTGLPGTGLPGTGLPGTGLPGTGTKNHAATTCSSRSYP